MLGKPGRAACEPSAEGSSSALSCPLVLLRGAATAVDPLFGSSHAASTVAFKIRLFSVSGWGFRVQTVPFDITAQPVW